MTRLRWGSSALFIMVNLHRKPMQTAVFCTHCPWPRSPADRFFYLTHYSPGTLQQHSPNQFVTLKNMTNKLNTSVVPVLECSGSRSQPHVLQFRHAWHYTYLNKCLVRLITRLRGITNCTDCSLRMIRKRLAGTMHLLLIFTWRH